MNDKLYVLIKNRWTIPVAVGAISSGIGFGVGYIIGRRQKYELHVVPEGIDMSMKIDELAKMRENQNSAKPEPVVVDEEVYKEIVKEDVVEDTISKPQETVIEIVSDPVEEVEVITHNIFANDDSDWNYEEEKRRRSVEIPYILHKDEFFAQEKNYSQTTLTFYAGDQILCDEENQPIYNVSQVIGDLKFGHGSGDPNVVYIRNDKRRAEYEVFNDPGLYTSEVLGMEIEPNDRIRDIRHSQVRKFRID